MMGASTTKKAIGQIGSLAGVNLATAKNRVMGERYGR